MKKFLLIIFILCLLIACGSETEPAAATPAPVPEHTVVPAAEATIHVEDPVAVSATEVAVTLPPVPTPTPEPTPEPTPTPVPTPTPIPFREDEQARKLKAFAFETESFTFVSTRSGVPSVLAEPSLSSTRISPYPRINGVNMHEWIVLGTVETESRTYYHLRPIGAEGDGYLDVRRVFETMLEQPENKYAVLVRPNGIVYSARTTDSPVAAHAGYEVVRVIGIDSERGYAAILTGDNKTGYVELGQLRFLSEEEFNTYLHLSCEAPESSFSPETLVSDAQNMVGTAYTNAALFLYDLLRAEGLKFNAVYYDFYQKPLEDEELYPKHLYVTPVYNTLLFKLFNSAGDLVTCNGKETEWEYIGDFDAVEPGDLLFFSDETGKGSAVIPQVEVVVHGKYSGDVTDCGLYLGEGRMLTVKNGFVTEVEIDPTAAAAFDSARRIHTQVVDENAHLVECMISATYDRLGTPYNSYARTGDASYDCSGLICWLLRGYDYVRADLRETTFEITATAFSRLEELKSPTSRITFVDTGVKDKDGFKDLKRGDLIMLMNESHGRVGHIMIYLGGNTVIHSTRIDARYQGTLIARFRPHLQDLYASSRRIGTITRIK